MHYPLLSFFSGAGGLDLGFAKAGFQTLWANEYDKKIFPSYKNHFPDVLLDNRPIQEIPNQEVPKSLGREDVLGVIGGPPCQAWSAAGSKRGAEDPRGRLFFEYIRMIEYIRPTFFVAENVHGLIHKRNQESFSTILGRFAELGYNVQWKLLNAADFGVSQDRKRVIVVGYHKEKIGKTFKFPEPKGNDHLTLKIAIGDLKDYPINTVIAKSSKDLIANPFKILAQTHKKPSSSKTGIQNITNHDVSEGGYSPIFLSRNRRRNWDQPSFTILATDRHIPFHPDSPKMLKIGKDKMILSPNQEHKYRRLSVRECARIQGFPDDYHFLYAHPRDGYKMVGNAVPVPLATAIASKIMEDLRSQNVTVK